MGRRVSAGTDGGDGPVVMKRGREDALLWARALVAKGIRVVRLRSGKAATRRARTRIALTAETRR